MSDEPRTTEPADAPAPDVAAVASPPDLAAIAGGPVVAARPRGLRRLVAALFGRWLSPQLEAQRDWNAAQAQIDAEIVRYLHARLAATHRHYDGLLAEQGRRQDEIDARHRQLERELVAHVHDLVARIDLVLLAANREKQALAFALEDARARLTRLEQLLRKDG